ncbi:adaptin protein [Salinadaptatus halalkaliphilus]|uniref:adaptin protein n=1 Tax=Salinadaptatus halalkaliphilus TaxID=2419781 RepID=UPI001FE37CD4|nr:adaptin protein [Salinadaptatus halalkaliphilus]
MYVLAFDRDWTVDVNPPPNREAVPLEWVRYWAHEADHQVWAIGNQDLVYEAGIPGVVEAIRRYHGDLDVLGEQDESGRYESWPSRERRLELLAELFPDAARYIVVDDLDLSHVDDWDHYTAWEFLEAIESHPLKSYLYPPPADSAYMGSTDTTSSHSDHVDEIRQQLRAAEAVELPSVLV